MKLSEFIGVCLALGVGTLCLLIMWNHAAFIVVPFDQVGNVAAIEQMKVEGLMPYFKFLGILLLVIAIAFILIDREEAVSTIFGEKE